MRRVCLAALAIALAGAAPAAGVPRPNVVIIETDDQTQADMAWMPRTRALIGEPGTTFPNSVVSLAECCPSRATLLTGRYAHNHGVLSTHPPFGGWRRIPAGHTLAVWLRRAGYATALVGKYGNGFGDSEVPAQPPGWTEFHGLLGGGIYSFFGARWLSNGVVEDFGERYQTDLLTERAVEVVRRRLGPRQPRPLFLWLTYVAPHVGQPRDDFLEGTGRGTTVPSPLYADRFAGVRMPRSPSFNEADVFDKPLAIQLRPRIEGAQLDFLELSWKRRIQALQSVDAGVARVIDALRASGELRRTLIVFTSDNGFMQGQHRVPGGKLLPYEPSIRVPLLIRGPGVPVGQTREQLVWNGDLAPTILAAAKGRASRPFDGMSLWPVLRDPRLRLARAGVLLEGSPKGTRDSRPRFAGVRTDRYLYVRYRLTGEEELYDLQRDPDQLVNLAYRPGAEPVRQRLAALLYRLRTCRGTGCR